MDTYPVLDIIKDILAKKDKSIDLFLSEIGRSRSWLYKIESIGELPLEILLKISDALEFDLLSDYYNHLGIQNPPKQNMVNDHDVTYDKIKPGEITVQISLRGKPEMLSGLLKVLKNDCDRYGYKII